MAVRFLSGLSTKIEFILLGQSSRDNRWEGPAFELTCHLPVSGGKLSEYRKQVTNKEALPVSRAPEPHTVILSFKNHAHTHVRTHTFGKSYEPLCEYTRLR